MGFILVSDRRVDDPLVKIDVVQFIIPGHNFIMGTPMFWVFGSNQPGAFRSREPGLYIKQFDDMNEAVEFAAMCITHPITHPMGGHYTCTWVYREDPGDAKGYIVICCHKGD